jgi:hypothetical protein
MTPSFCLFGNVRRIVNMISVQDTLFEISSPSPHVAPTVVSFATYRPRSPDAKTRGVIVQMKTTAPVDVRPAAGFLLSGCEPDSGFSADATGKLVQIDHRGQSVKIFQLSFTTGDVAPAACGNALIATGAYLLKSRPDRRDVEFTAATSEEPWRVHVGRYGDGFRLSLETGPVTVTAGSTGTELTGLNRYVITQHEPIPPCRTAEDRAVILKGPGSPTFYGPNGLHKGTPDTGLLAVAIAREEGFVSANDVVVAPNGTVAKLPIVRRLPGGRWRAEFLDTVDVVFGQPQIGGC